MLFKRNLISNKDPFNFNVGAIQLKCVPVLIYDKQNILSTKHIQYYYKIILALFYHILLGDDTHTMKAGRSTLLVIKNAITVISHVQGVLFWKNMVI